MGSSNDITGALLPIRPESPQVQFISFLTDVIPTYNGLEQRRALRTYPRHSLSVQYIETDEQVANKLKNQFTADQTEATAQGYWFQATNLETLPTTGINTLQVDTAYAYYQAGGFALLWEGEDNYEILEVAGVTSSQLSFTSNIQNTYTNYCIVLPAFYQIPQGVQWQEYQSHTLFDFQTLTTNEIEIEEYTYPETYGGYNVFPYTCNLFESDSTPVNVKNNIISLDSNSGIVDSYTTYEVAKREFVVGVNPQGRQQCYELLQLIEGLKGRQKSLWVPSYNEDLKASQDLDGTSTIYVEDNGFGDIFRDRTTYDRESAYNHIAVSYSDGSIEYVEIESITIIGNEIELVLTDSITASDKDDVKIMLLYYARLKSDTIEIEWTDTFQSFCRLPFITTATPLIGVGPGEYALISDGNQYIDTGDILTNSNDFLITYAFDDTDGNQRLAGAYEFSGSNRFAYIAWSNGSPGDIYVGWGPSTYNTNVSTVIDTYYTSEKRGSDYYLDDVNYTTLSGTLPNYSIYLFARNNAGSEIKQSGKISIYRSWTDSNRTVDKSYMWAVPEGETALGASEAAPSNCMYNSATNAYIENQGTGDFSIEALS
jgi:hypothetical protein